MSHLINREIEDLLGDAIIISPFHPAQLNTNSYDLCVGPWIARYLRTTYPIDSRPSRCLRLAHEIRPFRLEQVEDGQEIVLGPGERVLAHSMEFAGGRVARASSYPLAVTTSLRATSTAGRLGLSVCQCAGLGDVGFINRWVYEITNHTQDIVSFPVGSIIAQLEFLQVEVPDADTLYGVPGRGNYQNSEKLEELMATWRPESMLPKRLKVAPWVPDALAREPDAHALAAE